MTRIYLLPVDNWLRSLILACAVLRDPDCDVYFTGGADPAGEAATVAMLKERIPFDLVDLTGCPVLRAALEKEAVSFGTLNGADNPGYGFLDAQFGQPAGIIFAPAASPAACLKAAACAVRLGWFFLPLPEAGNLPENLPPAISLYLVPSPAPISDAAGWAEPAELKTLRGNEDIAALFTAEGLAADYLVLYNSADLTAETTTGDCLGDLRVKGLSLLVVLLAAYRPVFPFDAESSEPDPLAIEGELNRMVRSTGLCPQYLAVLASPGHVPFVYEEKKAIGAVTEEMVRDIHVRLNGDLFFDLSEGRLFQHEPGGLSAQLISTRRYHQGLKKGGGGKDVLIVSTPHVESGIIFSTDEALIEAQLAPLLEGAGFNLSLLQDREAHYAAVREALKSADFFLFSGHGGPESLHMHGRNLNRGDLSALPPLVAYASACSTVALVPHWYSTTEGLKWEGVRVESREVIGLSFVEKGALCFVGGATIEDLQYTTSTYSVFMEALLVKGLSVGEAVRELRRVISLYAATLAQKNPEAYRKYRWGTANAIHQQVLLGDPAFTPVPQKKEGLAFPIKIETDGSFTRLTVEIPEDRWRRSRALIREREESSSYYRCRSVEAVTPFGEDVFSWGDYYRVAPDAKDISETALKSSFIRLSVDLEPGVAVRSLTLTGAEAGCRECLLCGEKTAVYAEALEAVRCFKLPYLLQPPIALDMRDGWAYLSEFSGDRVRVHWLVPLLLLDENKRSAFGLRSFTFVLETAPAVKVTGRLGNVSQRSELLISAGKPGPQADPAETGRGLKTVFAQALSSEEGRFEISCPAGSVLVVDEQFPLHHLLEYYNPPDPGVFYPADGGREIELVPAETVPFTGYLFDSHNGKPLVGALIRIFRGELDPVGDPLIEAYAGEALTGGEGEFIFSLHHGSYLLYAVSAAGGCIYKSGQWELKLPEKGELRQVFSLNRAARVAGTVTVRGYQPPDPPTVALRRHPRVPGQGVLTRVPVRRDGNFECLVSCLERFTVSVEEEGWLAVNDTNGGKGYRLEPGSTLERSYTLIPNGGS